MTEENPFLTAEEEFHAKKLAETIRAQKRRKRQFVADDKKARGGPSVIPEADIEKMQLDIVQKTIDAEADGACEPALRQAIYRWAKDGYPVARIADAWGRDRKQVYRVIQKIDKDKLPKSASSVLSDLLGS